MADKQKYEWNADLTKELGAVCEDIQPVAVTPAAGDVLFFDIMCGHTGGRNLAAEPRLALNHKYGISGSPTSNIT